MNDSIMQTPALAEAAASGVYWLMAWICILLVATVVGIHYEALERLTQWLPRLRMPARPRILILIVGLLFVHMLEIWVFGITLYEVAQWPQLGRVAGAGAFRLLDAVYLSAVTFTTVGYGDLTPQGPLRLMLGLEALSGFLLVTWSASFTYLEMQRNWRIS